MSFKTRYSGGGRGYEFDIYTESGAMIYSKSGFKSLREAEMQATIKIRQLSLK